MFAVLKTGGKQYRVTSGDVLRVEKLAADAGEKIQFNDILMVGDTIGSPLIAGAGVQAEVIDQIKGEKLIHFVKRRRKHSSKRTKGHRQQLTLVRITDILAEGADNSGLKAAIGARIGGYKGVASDKGDYAKNRERQAEMTRRVAEGDAAEKSAETTAQTGTQTAKADAKPAKTAKAKAEPKTAGGTDDLKQLSGVGPALEKKLHEAGITSFAQIAAWTPEDVAEMDEKLSFKGRIEREGWIDQARDMANTKG